MANNERWAIEEIDILNSYFSSNVTLFTLFQRLLKINRARSFEGMTRQLRRLRAEGGFVRTREEVESKLRVGYLDIECTNLNADFGIILCWYIKRAGQDKYDHALITRDEIINFKGDKRVVKEMLESLDNYDVLYTHYGADRRFDVPFIRTRALYHGFGDLLGPLKGEKFIRDTWLIARNKLKLSSNRLERIQKIFHVPASKTALEPEIWNKAMLGHPKSLKYIAEHCKADVDVLEGVHEKLKPVEKISYVGM